MKLVALLNVLLFLVACSMSTIPSYDLSKMPKYDMAVAEEKWSIVTEIEQRESQLSMVAFEMGMRGMTVDEKAIEKIKPLYDEVLYWKAITQLHVFHSQHDKAQESALKAMDAVDSILFILSSAKPQGASL